MDSDPNRYKQLFAGLDKKPSGSIPGQFVAHCPHPDHPDNKRSFCGNYSAEMGGVFHCKGCGWQGGGYDYAEYFGLENPKQYYNNYNGKGGNIFRQKSKPTLSDVEKEMAAAVERLENCPDLIIDFWDRGLVKKLGLGFRNNRFVYPRKVDGRVIGFKEGKHYQTPGLKCGVFPSIDIINEFDFNKPLIICEGEPDCVTALSDGKQAICFTAGANSIPRGKGGTYDLLWLSKWKIIVICYDNDPPGEKGAVKLKNKIAKIHGDGEIRIAKWNKDCENGFDISDSFKNNGNGLYFYDALDNAEIFKVCATGTYSAEWQEHDSNEEYVGFETMNLTEFQAAEFEPQFPLIEDLMDKSTISVIAGDEGTGKSWCILAAGLSLVSGVPLFDFFKIQSGYDMEGIVMNGNKLLYCQFEDKNFNIQERFKQMLPYYNEKAGNTDWHKNFIICLMGENRDIFDDNIRKIRATMDRHAFRGGIVIIDNMYSSTDARISEGDELKYYLKDLVKICDTYDASMLLGCHNKKGTEAIKDLISDQIMGSSLLRNVYTNCLMIHTSSLSPNLRIAKIVKGGRTGKNELLKKPFKLKWDDDTSTFKKGEVIFNMAAHFDTPKKSWEYRLLWEVYDNDEMQHCREFTREKFREYIPDEFSDHASTEPSKANILTRFLNRMKAYGFIDNRGRDRWFFIRSAMEELEVAGAGAK